LWKLAIKPGKPLTFGHYQGVPVIGLPGNPASTLVTFGLLPGPTCCVVRAWPMSRRCASTCRRALTGPSRAIVANTCARASKTARCASTRTRARVCCAARPGPRAGGGA
jgi:hypothetical protein